MLVMQDVSEAGLSELRGHELVRGSDPAGCDAAVCYLVDRIDEAFLATPGLRALATVSVGLDHIDLDAADRHRIPIAYTPDVLTEATADLTFALLLAAARRLGEAERYLRAGRWTVWSFDLLLGTDVFGKTLAVIGGGRIGRAVARRAEGFSMDVVMVGRDRGELEAALRRADFVVVTVPLSEQTRHLIGADELALMKQGAILVNSSRGPVVDERALAEALRSGHLGGAGLDVFEREPQVEPLLMECDNAVLVPHIGSATTETREGMARLACRGLAQILRGERPPNLANPQVWDQWAHRWA
ncbi:MAG TPA: D-glycerate dehydrogenase [Gaiellales bacterium]|nr:D-glycerate dehydrogenase [Gaiellales bacterium]